MRARHLNSWPRHLPRSLPAPETPLWYNLEVSARRHPARAFTVFHGSTLTYLQALREVEALAGFLQQRCAVAAGDRVLLDMQNCPQFIIAYYAILRADAVVVPVNPMSVTRELEHYARDSGARVALFGQELVGQVQPLLGNLLAQGIMATYGEYAGEDDIVRPEAVAAGALPPPAPAVAWREALRAGCTVAAPRAGADDLCAILYTSGTTGLPKGCMHSHRTLLATTVGGALWEGMFPGCVVLATAPFFHVTGMQHSMNATLYAGGTICPLLRWDPSGAGRLIEREGCTHWANVPTMVVDLLAHPDTANRDLSSMRNIFGGGAAMPEAVARELHDRCGIEYMEAYGMTETASQTHINPPQRLRRQCLGIPVFDTESIVVDPETLRVLEPGENGEILSRGPQLFLGYWGRPADTAQALVEVDGRRWLRTGDLGRMDEDGFFHISDRLKRMINASGFKVWPAEVESVLYQHEAIQEVAVIAAPDARRGETVKAVVVLKAGVAPGVDAEQIMAWCRARMAAYKVPRLIEFAHGLPRSGSGKIQWRALQDREWSGSAR